MTDSHSDQAIEQQEALAHDDVEVEVEVDEDQDQVGFGDENG
jgi:hypothetical protein